MSQGRVGHSSKCRRGKDAVGQIDHTVTTHKAGVDICNGNAYLNLGVVQYLVEFRGNGIREHVAHIHVDERCNRLVGNIIERAIFCLEVFTALVPPFLDSRVGGNKHGAGIVVHNSIARGTDILVPSRIELQQLSDFISARGHVV